MYSEPVRVLTGFFMFKDSKTHRIKKYITFILSFFKNLFIGNLYLPSTIGITGRK